MELRNAQTFERYIRLNRSARPVHVTVPPLAPDEVATEREVLTRIAEYAVEEQIDFHAVVAMWHLCTLALQCESDAQFVAFIGEKIGKSGADATLYAARSFVGWMMARESVGDSQVSA